MRGEGLDCFEVEEVVEVGLGSSLFLLPAADVVGAEGVVVESVCWLHSSIVLRRARSAASSGFWASVKVGGCHWRALVLWW